MAILKKGVGPTKKKKIVFKNKTETGVPNRNREFCFSKMEIVLKKVLCTKQALGF